MTSDSVASPLTGLTSTEAAARLKRFGPNSVTNRHHFRPLVAFIEKFNSPLLWVITAAALISYFTGSRTNAVILVAMVLLSVVLDFVNTFRSEHAVQKLIAQVLTTATAIRDGHEVAVPLADIVPGDVLILSAGDVIPADGYVLEENDLYINESALTGESNPVMKRVVPGAYPTTIDKARPDSVFMGTSAVTGYARMLVVRTGTQTSFGAIAERLQAADIVTDFEKELRSFSMFLMRVTLVMVLTVFVLNLVGAGHRGLFESFLFAVAIAIGLTPELLPVIMTVSMSRGAVRMAKQQVIVKHLPAIQNFGRMNVLCTDKTGTLTENKIAVVKYLNPDGQMDEQVLRYAYWSSIFHSGVANPLDAAIANARDWPLTGITKIDEVPFDFERRRESIVADVDGVFTLITKGAPEAVLSVCSAIHTPVGTAPLDPVSRRRLLDQYDQLSREGFKLLGVATKTVPTTKRDFEPLDETELAFAGFIALLDPPKQSAREAIDQLEALGIELKILTGDGAVLTEKICRDIDLPMKRMITGDQLAALPPGEWPAVVRSTTVFARIDPFQKEQIIKTLRAAGAVVGFLGDGINDAPALKAADVGLSVNNAVDVAKETADIVLMEHSLGVLADGVIEGRKTFQNTLKYIEMGLSSNFGNMFSMTVASAFLPFLPMLPTQILLNNFLYDSSQLTLSSDSVDAEAVKKPTVWDIKYIRRFMMVFGPISSLFDFATFGLMWAFFHAQPAKFQTGWFIESLATQVLVIYIIRTRKIPFLQSRPSKWLVLNTSAAVLIAGVLPFTGFGHLFGLTPLPLFIMVTLVAYIVCYLLLVEVAKRWFYRREARLHSHA